ncbi:MAG: phosphoribosylamine--glycine ligase [bacterium]|nr:phosphoribosylamine--glycine ligase [bacterium]
MKILVIGSGGREHAIVHQLSLSKHKPEIFAAPGNAGMEATCVNIKVTEKDTLLKFALDNKIDLTVVGPEASLATGIVDLFLEHNLKIFGPKKNAAIIEGSKEFAKDLMKKYNIPTADYATFSDFDLAKAYVLKKGAPIVIKYDGLAAGKGVVVAKTNEEAIEALENMLLDKTFGDASVVIEEYLEGPEFSLMAFVNGCKVFPMVIAQDHKRVFDNDLGPNTGGMGAYSPVPIISDSEVKYAIKEIMEKTASAMVKENRSFLGVLYGGLMKTKDGIKVIEFNARFGDPETEVVLPRLNSDFVDVILDLIDGKDLNLDWDKNPRLGVVMASNGYPGSYQKGFEINGLENTDLVFHMGTKKENGKYYTDGGRVLLVVGSGKTLKEAQANAYANVRKIECKNLFYRHDIGYQVCNIANIISGTELSKELRAKMKAKVLEYKEKGLRLPHLVVILVGNNPASKSYVAGKEKACKEIGIDSSVIRLDENITEAELLNKIDEINKDASIDGLLVQLPLPKHIDETKVINAISIDKDVDGFHPLNVAKLHLGEKCILPCTPKGIITMLKEANVEIAGKKAVVVGRSNIVGKPIAQLLLDNNATVTICHSKTANLKEELLQADIVIAAIGRPKFIKEDMIKKGAVVIDVGVNRLDNGKLCGDTDYDNILKKASVVTPVPGGVGPMTITSLMENTLEIFESKIYNKN